TIPHYLDPLRLILLSYRGQKPLGPDVHTALGNWVKQGGVLIVVDDDGDPYNAVRDWWNDHGRKYATPRQHLLEQLGVSDRILGADGNPARIGKGRLAWLRQDPSQLASSPKGDADLWSCVCGAADRPGLTLKEANYLLLRRGPYVVAAGL